MRLRFQELQGKDKQAQKFRAEQLVKDGQEDINSMLHYQGLLYIPKIIWTELISRHHNNPLAGYFGNKKLRKLVAQKYYWPMFRYNIDNYVKRCNICLALKAVQHKPYSDLQSLSISIYHWKDLLINFVMGLPILIDQKRDSYDLILVIVD